MTTEIMRAVNAHSQYLSLDKLTTNLRLARCLPRELAFRYHAMPVAEEGERITVAMADPNDAEGQLAVSAALGTLPYVVKADRDSIDALLEELWQEEILSFLHLLVYAENSQMADELSTYTQLLRDLLGARLSHLNLPADAGPALEAVVEEVRRMGHDLVIWGEPCQPLIDRLLFGPADSRIADQIPTSLLIARGFRWPLKRILLIVRQECAETNEAALEWVRRLAQPSDAAVTALAIAPPVPAMYSKMGRMQQGLTALLNTDTILGREMRQIARQLSDWKIDGTLRLRQGAPGWQFRMEVATGDYDLIIMGADRSNRWLRWLLGGQTTPLLRLTKQPVLIAKPIPEAVGCDQL